MSDELDREVLDFISKGLDNEYYISKPERVARKIMVELVKAERAAFLLLRDDEVSKWWNKLFGGAKGKLEKHKEKIRLYEVKLQAYNRLTASERRTLGIRKPTKPKSLD